MKTNMGSADRIIRVLVAAVIAVLILNGTLAGVTAWILGILGLVFVLTSVLKFCPIYRVLNLSSDKKTGAMQH
jgi:Inner membrane protein YgaP-like, transmembrane domain